MADDVTEFPVSGGNVTTGIVRVANTLRRPRAPHSASVDALLAHLHGIGFDGVPRALGYDDYSRQIVSFVKGYVDPDPLDLDVDRLFEVGALIRRMHDALSTFDAPAGAQWNVAIAPDRDELIYHHDLAPWNLVRTETTLTFIDWDGAGPGSRLWDLAYAAHGFVPLSLDASLSDDVAAHRLAALVNGYGLDTQSRPRLVKLLAPRIHSMYELLASSHDTGREPWSRLFDEGHGATWLDDERYTRERTDLWSDALR